MKPLMKILKPTRPPIKIAIRIPTIRNHRIFFGGLRVDVLLSGARDIGVSAGDLDSEVMLMSCTFCIFRPPGRGKIWIYTIKIQMPVDDRVAQPDAAQNEFA